MNPNANRDALHNLADALSEDVVHAPGETLLAEAAHDHGDERAFVGAFDRIAARAARQSRWRRIKSKVGEVLALTYCGLSVRPLMASAAALFVVVIAGGVYVHERNSGFDVARAPAAPPESRADTLARRWALDTPDESANYSSRMQAAPAPAAVAPPPAAGALDEARKVRTVDVPASAPAPARQARPAANPQLPQQTAVKPDDAPRAVTAYAPSSGVVASRGQQVTAARQAEGARLATMAAEANKSLVARTSTAAPPSFDWPARGRVILGFGQPAGGAPNEGINLALPAGSDVVAAESGVVVYAGSDIKTYGNLVLVRHDNGFVTAYAHASRLLVKSGDKVRRGQAIAKSGRTGSVTEPQLHFEIREGATPVDPAQYLPRG